MNGRRIGGALLMGLGGLAVAAVLLVAGVVLANYVDWSDAAEPLATVAAILSPPLAGGVLILALGRWLFGDWRSAAPLRVWGTRALGLVGAALVLVLGVMLALNLSTGFGDHNREMVIAMSVGVVAGLGLIGLNLRKSSP